MWEGNSRAAEREVAGSMPIPDPNHYSRFKITEEGNALSGKRLDLQLARITSGNDRSVSMFFGMEHITSGLNYLKLHFMLNSLTL